MISQAKSRQYHSHEMRFSIFAIFLKLGRVENWCIIRCVRKTFRVFLPPYIFLTSPISLPTKKNREEKKFILICRKEFWNKTSGSLKFHSQILLDKSHNYWKFFPYTSEQIRGNIAWQINVHRYANLRKSSAEFQKRSVENKNTDKRILL